MEEKKSPGCKRVAIVFSFLLYILFGIPLWWHLTEVYRARLPFNEVDDLANLVSSSNLSLPCELQIIFVATDELVEHSQEWVLRLEKFTEIIKQNFEENIPGTGCGLEVAAALDSRPMCLHQGDATWLCGFNHDSELSHDELDESIRSHIAHTEESSAGQYTIAVFLDGKLPVESVVGKYRHAWITYPTGSVEDSAFISLLYETLAVMLRSGKSTDVSLPLAADGTAILSFNLLNANPDEWSFYWDFDKVEAQFLLPVAEALRPVGRLSIESQVLYYTPSTVKSSYASESHSHVIDFKDLPFFVNANEWHLDTSTAAAGRSKVLHFNIFVPGMSECPLRIRLPTGRLSSSNGFSSPGWGGVVIWNPPGCQLADNQSSMHQLSIDELEESMEVIVAQVRTLFGLSSVPTQKKKPKISTIPNMRTGFTQWEVDILLRRRAVADVKSTASTLTSLLRLVKSLPKMVIKDEIGVQVKSSLEAAKEAVHGASSIDIAEAARKSRAWAEAAFFHPSIMSLLHYPKEHQFAIYTPFFAPALLHTIVSVVKETRRFFRKRNGKQKAN